MSLHEQSVGKTDEWYTPAKVFEALGCQFDLDVATAVDSTHVCVPAHYGDIPKLGMVTFINPAFVRPTMVRGKPVYGWTWRKAGFKHVGETKQQKLLAFQLAPSDMPKPLAANQRHHIDMPLFRI